MTRSIELRSIAVDIDPVRLAAELTPGFGGDPAGARELLEQTVDLLTRDPRPDPWGSYLAHSDGATIGICAFKTAPARNGTVEIAYMTFPAFEGRGYATAMAAAWVEMADAGGAAMAIAHTLPEENASNRALKRNGFSYAGEVIDPEDGLVWRWEKLLKLGPTRYGEGDQP